MFSNPCVIKYLSERQEDFDEAVGSNEWNIQPPAVMLRPPHLSGETVVLQGNGLRRHPFEAVVVEQPPGFVLSVSPNVGIIPAADIVQLNVMCTQTDMIQTSQPRVWKGVVKVYCLLFRKGIAILTLQRGVTGTAHMLHALTHSSISRQVRQQM